MASVGCFRWFRALVPAVHRRGRAGRNSDRGRTVRARVAPRFASPPRFPLPLIGRRPTAMVCALLIRAMLAGLLAGIVRFLFARQLGAPPVNTAIPSDSYVESTVHIAEAEV